MEYRAVNASDPANELTHWKYIKKKKVDGKWRYYYDTDEIKKYTRGNVEIAKGYSTDGSGGTNQWKYTKKYTQSNDLLDSVTKNTIVDPKVGDNDTGYEATHVTYSQGTLSRFIARAEKWVFDNFLSSLVKTTKK